MFWQSEQYQVAIADLEPTIGTISPVVNLHGLQKALWKSRPVDISQWRHFTPSHYTTSYYCPWNMQWFPWKVKFHTSAPMRTSSSIFHGWFFPWMLDKLCMEKVQHMKFWLFHISTLMNNLWNDHKQPTYFMDNKLVVLGSCKEAKPVEQGVTIYPNT